MNILALDLGTQTGWARIERGTITSGTKSFKPHKFEGGGWRYLRMKQWLAETYTQMGKIHAIYFEEVRNHAGVDAAHCYGGFMATLTAWAEQRHIPYKGVPVGTIKKHWTGAGNASKQQMIDQAKAAGFAPRDDNEADALALLHYACAQNH